jgi:hypothetical protein
VRALTMRVSRRLSPCTSIRKTGNMQWYWWLFIGWGLTGLVALAMEFRDKPAMRENVGWAEVWPVVLGPLWLMIKLCEWLLGPGY